MTDYANRHQKPTDWIAIYLAIASIGLGFVAGLQIYYWSIGLI